MFAKTVRQGLALGVAGLVAVGCGSLDAADRALASPGDTFVDTLAEGLELDWKACPESLVLDDESGVHCAIVGRGHPFDAAEQLGLSYARMGIDVLTARSRDAQPNHLFAELPVLQPVDRVWGYDRLVYLVGRERVAMWVQLKDWPHPEGEEPGRWIAVRVDRLDGPFPHYLLAGMTVVGR